ncbi:hypothetical protein Ddye_009588 [Dipteronia dyeriana]|uniref:Clp1 P-loop domain-containing protein n=1 Tax=Dipteronia dyeriana TaxID=168575 RepID=A0AAD9XBM5_9ROSI|nr:hypothetical protein Ddye_009588 [Dipteronia dyeriana]
MDEFGVVDSLSVDLQPTGLQFHSPVTILHSLQIATDPGSVSTRLALVSTKQKLRAKVAYFDTDVGQLEVTAPGFLSLTMVDKPTPVGWEVTARMYMK